jgi:histidinol dehydrogenase
MKIILNPDREDWDSLCTRPGIESLDLCGTVSDILRSVKSGKDNAVRSLNQKFDGTPSGDLKVSVVDLFLKN